MKIYLIFILLFTLSQVRAFLDEGDEDTVVINALPIDSNDENSFRREKRQFSVLSPQSTLPADLGLEGSPCESLMNEKGNCTTISKCYPLIFSSEGEENRERGLVEMLKSHSGVCEPSAIPVSYGIFGLQILRAQNELICCTSGQQGAVPVEENRKFVKPETFVVGGTAVNDISKFPWLVSLHIRGRHSCGGSLITPSTVLTAAHCLMGLTSRDVSSMKIYFGHTDISQFSVTKGLLESRSPAQVKYHKAFSMRNLNDDIGLIILNSPISESSKVKPVELSTMMSTDKVATVAGWGQTSWTSSTSSRLLEGTMDVWTNARCQQKYQGFQVPVRITPEKQVCAGSPGIDSCRGDSGSALHVTRNGKLYQVGIVSFGGKCGEYPGVYTQPLPSYSAWIQKNKKD